MNPELNDQVSIRPDGKISTTLVDDVMAYGRTTREVAKDLEDLYGKQLLNPQISLLVRSFAPSRVYVTGEVTTPGEFINVGPNLSLVQAIARAGGLKPSAQPNNVIIIRRGAGETPVAYAADYYGAITGNDATSDVRLAPYDIVYVPRSGVANASMHFDQYIKQFVPISSGLNYQLNDAATAPLK
jgi:polysaccharide export outer membrane protein